MSKNKINIAVIGATGYTGLDLVLFLSKHPKVRIKNLCATKNLGKKISFFDQRIKKRLPRITPLSKVNWTILDTVFLSLPNGKGQKLVKKLYKEHQNIKFIDLSADFRITNAATYKKYYKKKHSAQDLIKKSIYSISEFVKKDINKYRIIGNPGCYPTSIQIPLMPLIKKKLINNKNIIIDSKSGYSGAGKNFRSKFNYKNLYHSTFAYSVKNHRHVAEIDQELKKHTNKNIKYTFNPHVIPTFRGILSSIYVELTKGSSSNIIRKELAKYYKDDKFIKILKLNSEIGSGSVLNTNNCEISVCDSRIKNKVIIFSAIDNLIKGASGQAIQNMNLIYNFPETLGLK